ncbi:MAG: DHHA1 domain-containing protein, partial [Clostridia bacterium]
QALLESVNKVAVIDHHRRAAEYIESAVLNFHEPYASSTCELVAELLQYQVETGQLKRCESQALLAGIVLDSKNFTIKTGVRTFEAAAFLRRAGADTIEVKRLLQNDLETYVHRAEIVKTAKIYKARIAIAAYSGVSDRVSAAQAADDLLNITRVQASFVLYEASDGVIISARSLGNINVQIILEKLGGGGHLATAGAQIRGKSMQDVLRELTNAIDSVVEDE